MAIKFLNSIEASGTRPVTITGGAVGTVAIKGNAAGWATGYLFTGSSGTNRGGFGALGSSDALTYFYIGDAYNDTTMVIEPNAGNVGIGTTSPGQKLHVNGDIEIGDDGKIISDGSVNIEIDYDNTQTDRLFSIRKDNATELFRVQENGNVGIGTNAPGEKLEVSGTAKATSVRSTGGGDGGFVLRQWTHASNYASLATNGMLSQEYCMISDGTNTFVGGGTGGSLYLRGPANDSSPQIEIDGSLCKVDTGDFKVEDGSIAVGSITNSTTNGRIDASNDVVAFSTSDIRLKDNIKSIDKALDKVNSIQGIEFDWIEKEEVHGNSGHDVGVIAQEIEEILPDVVTTRDSGYKAVKYEKIVPLLIEAIKDLSKQVDGLKRLI